MIQQGSQRHEARQIIADSPLEQDPAGRVDHDDIVMVLGPINPAEDLHRLHVLPMDDG